MSGEPLLYVLKSKYDALLKAYMNAKDENERRKEAWRELSNIASKFDDTVLDDIHRFKSLEEENAYLIGSFKTLMAMKSKIETLEGKYNV